MLISETTRRVGYLIQTATTAGDWVPTTTNAVTCEVTNQNVDGATAGGGWPQGSQQLLIRGVRQ
jgi:hypothetical protein